MAKMIPSSISPDIKSNAEKNIFNWFKNAPDTENWVVLHSLGLVTHQRVIHGETDFLVLAPGLGMFAIEVKGGRVTRKMGKWCYINKYGNIDEKVRGPFDQAWECIYSIRKSIESKLDISHQYLRNIIFGIGVMFPDIHYSSIGVDEAQWQVFDINDGKNVTAFIKRISAGAVENLIRLNYPVTEKMYPSVDDICYLVNLLRGDFDADIPLKIMQKYSEEKFLTLTNEQSVCIEQLRDNPRALIRGTAGTGKTLLAIEAVKQAVRNDEKVAFFCFNKLLGKWLQDYFSDTPLNESPTYVGNFHSYMISLLRDYGIDLKIDSGNMDDHYFSEKLPDIFINHIKDSLVQFDRIIVDEAQDLVRDKYLNVMDRILFNGLSRGKWTMFGDFSMQSIYVAGMTEYKLLDLIQNRAFFAIFRLKKNCRNTKKICIEIQNIIGIPENAAFKDVLDTPAVNHIIYNDLMDQKKHLEELLIELKEKNISEKDIVILSPKIRSKSVVGLLNGYNIADYSVKSTGRIRFSTIQAFKGLESSTIILTDIESYQDEKLIYVGLSRARFNLYILETESASSERVNLFFKRRLANDR